MEVVEGVDKMLASGSRITFTMRGDAEPDEKALARACEKNKIKFVSLTREERKPAGAAWVVECPGFT